MGLDFSLLSATVLPSSLLPSFLPAFLSGAPFKLSEFLLLGMVLLAGLVGGRIAALTRVMPVITGYIVVGFVCGPGGLNLITDALLQDMRVFVDISLGLILFDLGRRIDWHWLRGEKWMLVIGLLESALTFAALTALLMWFDVAWRDAALVGAIGVATSAAVVMRVASDVGAEGPVTRRALSLVAINNLFALLAFTVLLSFVALEHRTDAGEVTEVILHPLYLIVGSVLLGALMFQLLAWLSRLLTRSGPDQFILQLAMIVAAVGLAEMLRVSVLLTLLTLGLFARNAQHSQHSSQQRAKRSLPFIDFGDLGQLSYVFLFVMTGATLKLTDFSQIAWLALLFIGVRYVAKALPIFVLGWASNVSTRQSAALSLTLTPIAGVGVGMTFMLGDYAPHLASQAGAVLVAAVTLMQFAGPIAARAAFTFAREASPDK
jgi:NhaP-type Na+/H+ or K+/H+ antiporter